MSTKVKAPLTKNDLGALVELCKTLDDFGVYDICAGGNYRSVHLNHDRLVEAIRVSGAKVTITRVEGSVGGRTYHGEFLFKGAKVYGVLYEDELEVIGYHLVDGKPVPMVKSATA